MRHFLNTAFYCLIGLFCMNACQQKEDTEVFFYRDKMREFVIRISETARAQKSDFIVVPQNGIELITLGEEPDDELALSYLDAIDGHGQEELYFGFLADGRPTPANETDYLLRYLRRSHKAGKVIFSIDYCTDSTQISAARLLNEAEGFVSYASSFRELDQIPDGGIPHENSNDILRLCDARNFLYLINPQRFPTKESLISALRATNYDVLVIDLFLQNDEIFTREEVEQLREKANGATRLVLCYMSIGEAEDYRYYWNDHWNTQKPAWLERENPEWPGNYKVKYWQEDWQGLICGQQDSYLTRILDAGFDGVYLDIVDGYEYFEE